MSWPDEFSNSVRFGLGCKSGGLDALRVFLGRGGRQGWGNTGFGFKIGGGFAFSGILSGRSSFERDGTC